ncbi:MAG TPA: LysR family transcriptional regulator [Pseudolabrys sp.]|jgi:DNA-binding transcriptional LysR family regulator|nr:LysR family transcriptional regulator [Pseudolabrys sp.]
MTLEQLRIFVAVAERQHVTQAARALNLAQSAASHAIASLEAQHDTKLFSRVGRRIELTEAGQVFLTEAKAVLARAEAAELALSEFGAVKRGTLSVQASQTIAGYWLPRHLVAFRSAYPQIQVRLTIGNTEQAAAAVQSGAAEVGFVEGTVESESFVLTPVARDQLIVVTAPDHPWAGRARLTAANLLEGDWVLREPGSGTRSVFENAVSELGLDPGALRIQLELPSNEAVRAAVEAGLGATAISASVAAPSIEAGLLQQVNFSLPERQFYALRHRERYLSRAADALLAIVKTGGRANAT